MSWCRIIQWETQSRPRPPTGIHHQLGPASILLRPAESPTSIFWPFTLLQEGSMALPTVSETGVCLVLQVFSYDVEKK